MIDQSEQNKQDLISLLNAKEKRAILMVGAGSSALVSYPTWRQLVEDLSREFAPALLSDSLTGNTVLADHIKHQAEKVGKLEEYYKFLERTFQQKASGTNHLAFHMQLVNLGFCGLVTSNYDSVLESAVNEYSFTLGDPVMSEPIDLCATDRPYRVFDFLRSLGTTSCNRYVLHLHGYYNNPSNLILTRQDYLTAYGECRGVRGNLPTEDNEYKTDSLLANGRYTILDTIHRKVIWALMTMHPLVFVGFSLTDEFFLDMLKIVQQDFKLFMEPFHFALMGYTTGEEKIRIEGMLRDLGVRPVFYCIPSAELPGANQDHNGLKSLVAEIANTIGVSAGSPSLDQLNKRMLEL